MRVAIAGMFHETNTFAAERNDAHDATVNVGPAIIEKAHPKNFIGGFLEGMAGSGVELVPTVEIRYIHGGIIHADVFAHDRDRIVAALRDAGPLDAVYFALHGAMAAEDPYTDAEGELIAAARAALGDIPFVATYDFHMIVSDVEAANLAAAFPNDTNPHIDAYEQGLAAAGCLRGILGGEVRPVTRVVHIPIIGPNIGQSTWSPDTEEEPRLPMFQLNQLRAEMERTPGIINLTILGGYGYADTPDASMAVIATADGDAALAERMARGLGAAARHPEHPSDRHDRRGGAGGDGGDRVARGAGGYRRRSRQRLPGGQPRRARQPHPARGAGCRDHDPGRGGGARRDGGGHRRDAGDGGWRAHRRALLLTSEDHGRRQIHRRRRVHDLRADARRLGAGGQPGGVARGARRAARRRALGEPGGRHLLHRADGE